MNKADLVNVVSAQTGQTKTDVSSIVDATIETIVTIRHYTNILLHQY